ncbi:Mss4-like protein [Xylariomycetidae sp. FL2044]|nr:Mss4-like protein [Xylariomycetidae sp. FL2044]
MAEGFSAADKSKPYIALNSVAEDRGYKDGAATATCLCGAVQLSFPTEGPGLINTFVCNCADCRKLTASMFASNFAVDDEYLRHVRGRENLTSWANAVTPLRPGTSMTDHFCSTCGTLMYRVSSAFPRAPILRVGTVDDLSLHETKLRPQWEQFTKDRVGWFAGVQIEGIKRLEGNSETYVL